MKQTFKFYKTLENRWYIDIPNWPGMQEELEMVEGADIMLDIVSDDKNECYLELSDQPFKGADILTLDEDLSDSIGGGNYIMDFYKGQFINHKMWLCSVTVSVFSGLPQMIYVGYPLIY